MRTSHLRRGVTLMELLVTLVILGIVSSIATLSVRSTTKPAGDDPTRTLRDSLAVAIAERRVIVFVVRVHGKNIAATARPDGRVIADTAFHFNALAGQPANAR